MDDENPIPPPNGENVGRPWEAAGMSRSGWYRHGKPSEKPRRQTQAQMARIAQVSLRRLQRAIRINKYAPCLKPFIWDGLITTGAAEKYLGNVDRMAALIVDLRERAELLKSEPSALN
jgi:hypothetical protein